jgi:hypothetical protein
MAPYSLLRVLFVYSTIVRIAILAQELTEAQIGVVSMRLAESAKERYVCDVVLFLPPSMISTGTDHLGTERNDLLCLLTATSASSKHTRTRHPLRPPALVRHRQQRHPVPSQQHPSTATRKRSRKRRRSSLHRRKRPDRQFDCNGKWRGEAGVGLCWRCTVPGGIFAHRCAEDVGWGDLA